MTWVWLGILAAGAAVIFFATRQSPLLAAIGETKASGNIDPIVNAIGDDASNTTVWDMAINSLWQAHAREAAADLIVVSIEKNDADVLHFWAQKVLEVEPEIAGQHFSEEFLNEKFRPKSAAGCGKCGCG